MGKVDENKHQKMDALFQSAYDLFLNQGIEKTSISDIAKKAGVAKGTFYLYFADKYEIRDRLIARTASRLFQRAHKALETADIPEFDRPQWTVRRRLQLRKCWLLVGRIAFGRGCLLSRPIKYRLDCLRNVSRHQGAHWELYRPCIQSPV